MENDNVTFGILLRFLRIGRSISQSDLAKRVNRSRSEIDALEAGRTTPSAEFIVDISNTLSLSKDERELLENALRGKLPGELQTSSLSQAGMLQIMNNNARMSTNDPTVEVKIGLEDLKNAVQEMSDELIRQQKKASPKELSRISDELGHLEANITQLQTASDAITAPVRLPSRADMEVRLVSSTLLDRLEEYRSDEKLGYLFIGSFVGAILGILSNWATNETFVITRFSIILAIIFAICAGAVGIWTWRTHRRSLVIKNQMF